MIFGLTKNSYSMGSGGVFRAQPSQTQPFRMELLAETVDGLRPMAVFIEIFCFQCLVGFWMSLRHLWRSSLNQFASISFWKLLFRVGDGAINLANKMIYKFSRYICYSLSISSSLKNTTINLILQLSNSFLKYYNSISLLELSIDHPWQLRLKFISHYAIRPLMLKQKGF